MRELTLNDLKTVSIVEASLTAGFGDTRAFKKVFEAAGYRVIPVSERKRRVLLVDLAHFLADRIKHQEPQALNQETSPPRWRVFYLE